MNRFFLLLGVGLTLAGCAAAPKRDPEIERLAMALRALEAEAPELAGRERALAELAIRRAREATGRERAHLLRLAQRRIEIAQATLEAERLEAGARRARAGTRSHPARGQPPRCRACAARGREAEASEPRSRRRGRAPARARRSRAPTARGTQRGGRPRPRGSRARPATCRTQAARGARRHGGRPSWRRPPPKRSASSCKASWRGKRRAVWS